MNDRSFVSLFRQLAVATLVVHAAGATDAAAQSIGATSVASAASFSAANDRPTEQVTRYRCTLIDGSTRLLIEDPRERHPGLADDCTLVRVAVAPLRPGSSDDSPPWVGFAARLIQGPAGMAGALPDLSAFLRDAARPMPAEMASMVRAASNRHRLDPALVSALIFVESRYRADARSPKGAMGLMQLMPATAARYGVYTRADLLDPRVNVDIGVRHLRALHDRYDGRVDLILAAYNAGEGAVERFGQRVPPFPETEDYVRRITTLVGMPETAFTP